MGNGCSTCFSGGGGGLYEAGRRRKDLAAVVSDPLDDLGHSFCYVRPDPTRASSSKVHSDEGATENNPNTNATSSTTTFKSISGASVSANTSTPLSTAFVDLYSYNSIDSRASAAAAFESSTSFASIPLQPIPRSSAGYSGPISSSGLIPSSGPIERGFMSGPIERGFLSGPLDRGIFSGPLEKGSSDQFQRSFSHGFALRSRSRTGSLIRVLQRALSKTIIRGQNSIVAPLKSVVSLKENDWIMGGSEKQNELTISSVNLSSEGSSSLLDDDDSLESQNLQWAQGKAGEDRVHVVVSEEHGWVFVGIYDGFNGPDAPDYLLSNLYSAVHKELKGLLWDDSKLDSLNNSSSAAAAVENPNPGNMDDLNHVSRDRTSDGCSRSVEEDSYPVGNGWINKKNRKSSSRSKYRGVAKKREENQRKWRCEFDRERLELDRRLKEQFLNKNGSSINHGDVLKALSQALKKTEEAYLDLADKMVMENPELALMGSCLLVMLMKGEDVYVMNVGDSRAVLAQKKEPDLWSQDLERINEETLYELELSDCDRTNTLPSLSAFQLTMDHSTSIDEEVQRIRKEHPDDACAITNDRVKGSLKVTRAFGAGFLKQPKWNDALLEMFRIDYVGTSPYINCLPSLYHHKLGPRDRFLILSSDGLYQYFTNEEAVAEVETFITWSPEGDPAQHLVEELLFRAAKKAGMDFHELLEIPQGDRRRYHDDVSIIVISLEGRIWRSCV
ncbi:OLC1v1007620C1 [Oldenlandia corymbosa var. corymbosa]|uniref:protein-serine/threonine phosphatase n=1 Tax=Oldenlandia corymbosa var. corymbosa TaxID=529605 RepID=A0AAV1DJL2_OLDCO|nr:OLC1v1007620C1 [Oldenlandia corymbosa var. corymbosa]